MKIKSIKRTRLITERLFPELYQETHADFLNKHNMLLPTYDQIKRNYQYPDDVRLLWKDMYIDIETEDTLYSITIKAGFLTDFGSVPKWARSVVPYDDLRYIVGYLVHDGMFGCNLGFKEANELLYAILDYYGVTWRKRQYVDKAVSWFGKSAYNQTQMAITYNKQFFKMNKSNTIVKL